MIRVVDIYPVALVAEIQMLIVGTISIIVLCALYLQQRAESRHDDRRL